MLKTVWWLRQGLLIAGGLFFLLFGVYVLIAAYHLKDPFSFVMTFFASNLIILISCALLAGFVIQVIRVLKGAGEGETEEPRPSDPHPDVDPAGRPSD